MITQPRARREGLVVERLGDEVLIFDESSSRGHCLSVDAGRVWDLCDGTRSVSDLGRELSLSADDVEAALSQLDECALLAAGPAGGYSRRELSKKAAKVALAVPVIYSLSVSPAAATPFACSQVSCDVAGGSTDRDNFCKTNVNCRSASTCSNSKMCVF